MSDLQLLTGLSTLISGYSQLKCGLSAFHWKRLVSLVWFASITHLASLTFLRRYLYRNKYKRWWRVIAMSALIVLLIVAIVPTRYFSFQTRGIPRPSYYAICYFDDARHRDGYSYSIFDPAWQKSFISAVLLGLGMLVRIFRLHWTLSKSAGRLRSAISKYAIKILFRASGLYSSTKCGHRLWRTLGYFPLLSCFLLARTLLDLWCSMAFEVFSFL